MFNKNISLSEAVAILIHTAVAAGGFYLMGFILSFLLVSPVSILIGLLFINIVSIIYYFSTLYAKVLKYLVVKVEACFDYLREKSWFKKVMKTTRKIGNTIAKSKTYQWLKITALLGYIQIASLFNRVAEFIGNKYNSVKNFVVSKYTAVKNWIKGLFTKKLSHPASKEKFSRVNVNSEVISTVNAEFVV